jgi:hypothetical protein
MKTLFISHMGFAAGSKSCAVGKGTPGLRSRGWHGEQSTLRLS